MAVTRQNAAVSGTEATRNVNRSYVIAAGSDICLVMGVGKAESSGLESAIWDLPGVNEVLTIRQEKNTDVQRGLIADFLGPTVKTADLRGRADTAAGVGMCGMSFAGVASSSASAQANGASTSPSLGVVSGSADDLVVFFLVHEDETTTISGEDGATMDTPRPVTNARSRVCASFCTVDSRRLPNSRSRPRRR